jgi:hypothetical protein
VALESLGQGMEEISALLAQGVEVRADDAEGLSAREGAKAAGDLLLDLGHAHGLFGKLFGDRGYLSQRLFEQLWEPGVQLITKLRKNMKNRLLPLFDKLLLRKRSICETINDQLKTISQIEHSRHRSPFNFFVNMIAGLVAYTFREKKPSLNIRLHPALPTVVL